MIHCLARLKSHACIGIVCGGILWGFLLFQATPAIGQAGKPLAETNEALRTEVDWEPLNASAAQSRLKEIFVALKLNESEYQNVVTEYAEQWEQAVDRLDLELQTVGKVSPEFLAIWNPLKQDFKDAEPAALEKLPKLLADDLSLWVGRELTRVRRYDEALKWLTGLEASATCDPASLLFYRGAVLHALWESPDLARADLQKLMLREKELPVRFRMTAKLMLADMAPSEKPNPLDDVSRLMSDVGRRLELGKTNEPVVKRETEIIEKLDKMIEDLEKKRQQQQQQQSAAGKGSQNGSQSTPMQDSQIAGGSGAGDVDRRDLGANRGWGDLPPAEREEALQKLSQQLPSHYREVIEGYFRKIATENSEKP